MAVGKDEIQGGTEDEHLNFPLTNPFQPDHRGRSHLLLHPLPGVNPREKILIGAHDIAHRDVR